MIFIHGIASHSGQVSQSDCNFILKKKNDLTEIKFITTWTYLNIQPVAEEKYRLFSLVKRFAFCKIKWSLILIWLKLKQLAIVIVLESAGISDSFCLTYYIPRVREEKNRQNEIVSHIKRNSSFVHLDLTLQLFNFHL